MSRIAEGIKFSASFEPIDGSTVTFCSNVEAPPLTITEELAYIKGEFKIFETDSPSSIEIDTITEGREAVYVVTLKHNASVPASTNVVLNSFSVTFGTANFSAASYCVVNNNGVKNYTVVEDFATNGGVVSATNLTSEINKSGLTIYIKVTTLKN